MKRILVVEDDRDLRFVIRMILERASYKVAEARNGIAALESIGAERPDLIIADLTMPVMNGVELVDQLAELAKRARPREIVNRARLLQRDVVERVVDHVLAHALLAAAV